MQQHRDVVPGELHVELVRVVAQRLAELHGGKCSIESELDKGTTVNVYLPNDEKIARDPRALTAAA